MHLAKHRKTIISILFGVMISLFFSFSAHPSETDTKKGNNNENTSTSAPNSVTAQEINLLPKYGLLPKNKAQIAADEKFLAFMDKHYKGNRKMASEEVIKLGWQFFRQGNMKDAMRRFNQAWLLDNTNGSALWGMAVIQDQIPGDMNEILQLFHEAEQFIENDIDFSTDYAKAIGIAAAQSNSDALLKEAFLRFAKVFEKDPQHVMNLQNWAITLFYIGNYGEAWKKIALAEASPRRSEMNPKFIAALQEKMPRP